MGEGAGAIGAGGSADVDLIAFEGTACGLMNAAHRAQRLIGDHDRFDVEEVEALHGAGGAFDAIRVVDGAAEHLIATADAEYAAAAADMRAEVDVPSLCAQEG